MLVDEFGVKIKFYLNIMNTHAIFIYIESMVQIKTYS